MSINPGRARNELVPSGSARMVPWKRRSERVRFLDTSRISGSKRSENDLAAGPPSTQTPPAVLDSLHSLPPSLSFQRRTTAPDTDTIHGSVTLIDIALRLQEDFGLRSQDVVVTWKGDSGIDGRLRQLGTYDCEVTVRGHGREKAPLSVQIDRLNE